MGKRKSKNKEEHLERKMKKLQEKIDKVRRRRHSSSRSYFSDQGLNTEGETVDNLFMSQVGMPIEDTTHEEVIPVATSDIVNLPAPSDTVDVPLDENILNILGDEPAKEDTYGSNIHKDIAVRWSEILKNGLKDETTKDILGIYDIPENLKLAKPPLLNPEIKAAVNENFIKRDTILNDKQKHLTCAISCLANLVSNMINDGSVINNHLTVVPLKQLSDIGRLLCNLHYQETTARRQFLVSGLSKTVKENIKDLTRDQWLFGAELGEKLRSLKAISKTGAEMKATSTVVKPKVPLRNRQSEASTSRTLNWRGPPPPTPRPTATRPNWPAGGRRQPPPVTSQRAAPPPPPQRRPARQQQPKRR